ncbi:MAG: hypothetical protein GY754_21190 [bacterium]|nr:hypothetical protein [bacterium]
MKKYFFCIIAALVSVFILLASVSAKYDNESINKIIPSSKDIPENFVFGKIPRFAKNVLKGNPWMLDKKAIKRLTDRIYPGGNYNTISNIHMTIMTDKKNPFGDDIVCYIIVYRDNRSAQVEIKKMNDFVGFNRDRAILLTKNNIVVFIHADNISNYDHIKNLANSIETKLESI